MTMTMTEANRMVPRTPQELLRALKNCIELGAEDGPYGMGKPAAWLQELPVIRLIENYTLSVKGAL
jgi:hypothetical protein